MGLYSNNKDIDKIVRDLVRKEKWTFEHGKKHGKLTAPNGLSTPVTISPSDSRAANNFRAVVRKLAAGIRLELQ